MKPSRSSITAARVRSEARGMIDAELREPSDVYVGRNTLWYHVGRCRLPTEDWVCNATGVVAGNIEMIRRGYRRGRECWLVTLKAII